MFTIRKGDAHPTDMWARQSPRIKGSQTGHIRQFIDIEPAQC
ncbi:MAG TPA: hypothetical protein VK670_01370 [Silvibacterium sp.]|nr:hypothetical protein [Silvibacterium sp.]